MSGDEAQYVPAASHRLLMHRGAQTWSEENAKAPRPCHSAQAAEGESWALLNHLVIRSSLAARTPLVVHSFLCVDDFYA